MYRFILTAILLLLAACESPTEPSKPAVPVDSTGDLGKPAEPAGERDPRQAHTVVIADVHGDIRPLRKLLTTSGLAAGDTWTGGTRTLIQTGDVLDRGDDEREIYELLWTLQEQAEQAGGRVVLMNGNHEVMNVMGDLRYVTAGGAADFAEFQLPDEPRFEGVPPALRGRLAAFLPGGEWAKRLAEQPVVARVDDRLYAHGGVHLPHVEHGIDQINAEMKRWMLEGGEPPRWATDSDGPLWTRTWSGVEDPDCEALEVMLKAANAKSLAVGHTPQKSGIKRKCDGKLWLLDTGMAAHYGGPAEALGIFDGDELDTVEVE